MKDAVAPVIDPAFTVYLAAGLMAFFAVIGIRYTYRALMFRFVFNKPFNNPKFQEMAESMPPHRSTLKAVAAYSVALVIAWFFFT